MEGARSRGGGAGVEYSAEPDTFPWRLFNPCATIELSRFSPELQLPA